jgi:hypothetical protein
MLASSSGVYPLKLATVLWLSYTKTLSISNSKQRWKLHDRHLKLFLCWKLEVFLVDFKDIVYVFRWYPMVLDCQWMWSDRSVVGVLFLCVYKRLTIEKPHIHTCIAYQIRKTFPLVLIRTRCTRKIAAVKSTKSFWQANLTGKQTLWVCLEKRHR